MEGEKKVNGPAGECDSISDRELRREVSEQEQRIIDDKERLEDDDARVEDDRRRVREDERVLHDLKAEEEKHHRNFVPPVPIPSPGPRPVNPPRPYSGRY